MGNKAKSSKKGSKARVANEEPLNHFVFLQDNQGYSHTPFLFKTNCNWSVQELEALSWKTDGAGRLSAGFRSFRLLLLKQRFSCELIKQFAESATPPADYPVIKGATGNY